MTTNEAHRTTPVRHPVSARESLDEQVRRRGLRPIRSVRDLACAGIFDTDEELDDFLAFVHAERHANIV